MDWKEVGNFVVAILLAGTLFLLHVVKEVDEALFKNGKPNLKIFALLLPATILGAGVGYILCFNFFQTPIMKEYIEYRTFASILFGGFGAITIPALSYAAEMLIAFGLDKLKSKLNELNNTQNQNEAPTKKSDETQDKKGDEK